MSSTTPFLASAPPSPSLLSSFAACLGWLWRSPLHRLVWFLATTIGFVLSLLRLVRCQPRGKDRFTLALVEKQARELSGDPHAEFDDAFHREALPIVVDSFLRSEMREFVIALPLAPTLEKKLRIERAFKLLSSTNLPPPVFIVGLPRTGSTLLHQLCGLDPAARAVRAWEFKMPLELSNAPADALARRDRVQKTLNLFYSLAPRIRAVHLVGADDPDECVQGFLDCVLPDMYCWGAVNADAAHDWFVSTDMSPMLRNYRRLLAVVLAGGDQKQQPTHLILKSPHHTWMLPALANVFPDARFVWIHRDPAASVGSTCSMNEAILDAMSARFVHPHVLGHRTLERLAQCMDKGLRDRAKMDSARFVDVQYSELRRDPLAAVAKMYRDLGLGETLSHEFKDRILIKLEQDVNAPWRGHGYSLEHFGLSEEGIREKFGEYGKRRF